MDKNRQSGDFGKILLIFTLVVLTAAGLLLQARFRGGVPTPAPTKTVTTDFPPTSLSSIPNYEAIKARYGLHPTPAQEKFFEDNRFLLIPAEQTIFNNPGYIGFDEMLDTFDRMGGATTIEDRKPEDTVFVNPDLILHAYHKFFELTLEELEKGELSAALGAFLRGLHANLATAAERSSGKIRERYRNLEAEIVLARVLFENQAPAKADFFSSPEAENAASEADTKIDTAANANKILAKYSSGLPTALVAAVKTDLASIYDASSVDRSPLFGQYSDSLRTDYTQFTPRSHYSKSSALRAYFRTMMLLGRSSYFLSSDDGISDTSLLVGQFGVRSAKDGVPLDAWKKIMDVTGFYAGKSDDLTYNEWQTYLSKVFPSGIKESEAVSTAGIKKLVDDLDQVRLPQILSDVVVDENIGSKNKADLLRDSLSFRVFGQRFTFDAWILNSLTGGQENGPKLPSMPSALFVPAAFGDNQARLHAQTFLKRDAGFSDADLAEFNSVLDAKKADIEKVTEKQWFDSMGSAWLYVLGSLTRGYGREYPAYMRALAFLDKQIETFLGSFTELKHDTLLYAKQSYTELGGGAPEPRPIPPVVKGFVEPNPEFWNRFMMLIDRSEKLFVDNNLFENHSARERLKEFKTIVAFYAALADKELQRQAISDEEYERLRTTRLSFMSAPFDGAIPDGESGRVGLIADIHTDGLSGRILYEAVGKPHLMLTAIDDGTPRVTAGVAFNHYELTAPLGGKRLTDEDWKKRVYEGAEPRPTKNFWYEALLP